jgi:DNA-binding transcriptional MerR regulator/effector-binding domain-containing protein
MLDWPAASQPRIGFMHDRISIGDFAKMTHLSVKALRHYHDVGVLDPAVIDTSSGYRYYDRGQIVTAQVIRRFRDLGMPLDDIRALITAPDVEGRSEVIIAHLERMESQLSQTQAAVASLRSLLERPRRPAAVEHRSVGAVLSVTVAERVTESAMAEWWTGAFAELYAMLAATGVQPVARPGALYPAELFEAEVGEVVAFVPVSSPVACSGRVAMREIPAAELAVAVHRGPFSDLDQTYAEVGKYITAREIGVDGPIREYYVVSYFDTPDESRHVTEVCWPVFHTGAPH